MGRMRTLLGNAARVRRERGVGLLAQAAGIVRIALGRGRMGVSEYYDYRLFDEERRSPAAQQQFLGWRGERLLLPLNNIRWHALANDKILFYSIMRGVGIPVP